MRCRVVGLILLSLFFGCDEVPPSSSNLNSSSSSTRSAAPPPPGAADVELREDEPNQDDSEQDPSAQREVARAGVGKQGRNYGGGIITEPVRQYFHQSQRIQFLNMQKAMTLYKAEHGSVPKTHDDFMKHIIEANEIQLPELPAGQQYAYDPEKGELMVEKPRPQ